jgi:hypothetical protein
MKDPDVIAFVEKVNKDAEARIEAMDAKVTEALAEAKKAKAEARKLQEIDPAEVQRLEDALEKAQGAAKESARLAKVNQEAAEKATKALESESKFNQRLLSENGLTKVLSENGVTDPAYLAAAMAMHMPNLSIVTEGDNRKAMYGDKDVATAIKEWAAGDIGKKFVSAPVNAGGGAHGGGGAKTGQKDIDRATWDGMGHIEKAAHIKAGGAVTD